MNSINVKIERKIWKFINLNTGFLFGRKGTMGYRQRYGVNNGPHGSGPISWYLYYNLIPYKTLTIPIGISFNKGFINEKIFCSIGLGAELNFIADNISSASDFYDLSQINSNFWSFKPQAQVNNGIPYKHENLFNTPSFIQYYFEAKFNFVIYKRLYINLFYTYVSDLIYRNGSKPNVSYESNYKEKLFLHRYGTGIGLHF
jgi:hypothetical protein